MTITISDMEGKFVLFADKRGDDEWEDLTAWIICLVDRETSPYWSVNRDGLRRMRVPTVKSFEWDVGWTTHSDGFAEFSHLIPKKILGDFEYADYVGKQLQAERKRFNKAMDDAYKEAIREYKFKMKMFV